MQKNGLNLEEAYSKLLEKMEEMTRYVIDLNKEQIRLKSEVKQLKEINQCLIDQHNSQ